MKLDCGHETDEAVTVTRTVHHDAPFNLEQQCIMTCCAECAAKLMKKYPDAKEQKMNGQKTAPCWLFQMNKGCPFSIDKCPADTACMLTLADNKQTAESAMQRIVTLWDSAPNDAEFASNVQDIIVQYQKDNGVMPEGQ